MKVQEEVLEVRVQLDPKRMHHGLVVRAMSLSDLAFAAGVSLTTASSAAAGRPVNIATALRVARALNARPVITEMQSLVRERPAAS